MMLLTYLAFALIALAILLYVLMDGWDLGVGILFLLAAREQQRDEMMESIAPFWDGNETWLVFGGVTLFAAFPAVYALTLPALYLPLMVMLFALVFRGISFEFRAHSKASKMLWNWAFALGSIIAAFAQLSEAELEQFQPTLVYADANNRISHTNRSIPKQMAAA